MAIPSHGSLHLSTDDQTCEPLPPNQPFAPGPLLLGQEYAQRSAFLMYEGATTTRTIAAFVDLMNRSYLGFV